MLTTEKQAKLPKNDVPIISIPELCVGPLTGPTGETSKIHCRQNKRGTTHINIGSKTNSKSFLEV
jgi:hypothetical protein